MHSIECGTSTARPGPSTSPTSGRLRARDAAEHTEGSLTSLLVSSTAIDLGHHLAFAAHADSETTKLVQLGAASDGLVVRWCEPGAPAERLHDRLARLVGANNLRDASVTANAIASCMAELVEQRGTVRIAVPVNASLGHVSHLRSAFEQAGYRLDESTFVRRPYAVLSHWLVDARGRPPRLPRGKTLVIDNDGGRSSAIVVDIPRCAVLAEGQITNDSTADPETATTSMRELLEGSYGSQGHAEPVPWSVLSASIADIVVAGSGADHPRFRQFLDERFPASEVQQTTCAATEIVVHGLNHLDRLRGYRCAWPTVDVTLNDQIIRRAGTWQTDDASATVAPVGTDLGFGGLPLVLGERGAEHAAATLSVPLRVGPFPLMSINPSGSIEIRGTDASIRLHVDWPVPGVPTRSLSMTVEDILDLTIDRAPFTPRDDPPRRATGKF